MSEDNNVYPKPSYAWYTVALLLLIYTFSFIDRQILSLLGPAIKADFGISDTEFGLLVGFAFAVFYTFIGLFCARIADSRSRIGLIAIGLFLWSLATAASSLAKNFVQLFVLRMGVGIGEATLGPSANSIIADSFPKQKLSTALSVYAMGIPVGSALAFIIGGSIIPIANQMPDIAFWSFNIASGWQKALLLVGAPGLLLTLFVLTLKEPARQGQVAGQAAIPIKEVFAFFKSKYKAYTAICFGVSMNAAFGFGSVVFLAFFFSRYHGLSGSEVGLIFGSISIITGPLGLLFGGYIADKWFKAGKKDAHIRALMMAPIGFAIPSIAIVFVSDTTLAWVLLGISNFFVNSPSGVAYASLQIITPNQMRGQIISIYIMSTSLIGYGGGPFAIGFMSDYVFSGESALRYSYLTVALITIPLGILTFLWGRKAYMRAVDQENARELEAQNA
ncbi:spinster family MFS transporter [Kordiimonas aquimaris]|uniref:spinster family MFS transporter n=1 Tax=Kordiimonas aquimaris TaxID=707591 RepID=UPI0021D0192C|nr:MFS transporter [Kordiimonas aquimaris]